PPPTSRVFPYTTLFRSLEVGLVAFLGVALLANAQPGTRESRVAEKAGKPDPAGGFPRDRPGPGGPVGSPTDRGKLVGGIGLPGRSEEHTAALQSRRHLV